MNKPVRKIRHLFFPALMVILLAPAMAERTPVADIEFTRPVVLDKGIVKEILSPDMIMLDDDRRYRLDNILIPPYEDALVMDELSRTFLNKRVTIYSYHDVKNKPGIPFVQVVTDNNVWMQEYLVAKGLVWAHSTDSSQQMAHALKLVEDGARVQQAGFWKNPVYAIKTPQNIKKYVNSYQIVEGKILSVNERPYSGVTYLNFGKNWKTDFDVRVRGNSSFLGLVQDPRDTRKEKPEIRSDLKEEAREDREEREEAEREERREEYKRMEFLDQPVFEPHKWENRIVRVRGVVRGSNFGAPYIEVTEKEQIDFVDDK